MMVLDVCKLFDATNAFNLWLGHVLEHELQRRISTGFEDTSHDATAPMDVELPELPEWTNVELADALGGAFVLAGYTSQRGDASAAELARMLLGYIVGMAGMRLRTFSEAS